MEQPPVAGPERVKPEATSTVPFPFRLALGNGDDSLCFRGLEMGHQRLRSCFHLGDEIAEVCSYPAAFTEEPAERAVDIGRRYALEGALEGIRDVRSLEGVVKI